MFLFRWLDLGFGMLANHSTVWDRIEITEIFIHLRSRRLEQKFNLSWDICEISFLSVKSTHPSVVHSGHSLCKHTCLSLYHMIDEFIYGGRSSLLPNSLQHLLNITAGWMELFNGFISRGCWVSDPLFRWDKCTCILWCVKDKTKRDLCEYSLLNCHWYPK